MVSFSTSCVVLFALVAIGVWYRGRRPVGTPLTWGEAMVAAAYIFFLFFWAYGVVPDQWLRWADGGLKWGSNKYFLLPRYSKTACDTGHWCWKYPGPITVTMQTLRDIVAVLIYLVVIGLNVAAWPWWQNRGKTKPVEVAKSDYGRPLVREGGR